MRDYGIKSSSLQNNESIMHTTESVPRVAVLMASRTKLPERDEQGLLRQAEDALP